MRDERVVSWCEQCALGCYKPLMLLDMPPFLGLMLAIQLVLHGSKAIHSTIKGVLEG